MKKLNRLDFIFFSVFYIISLVGLMDIGIVKFLLSVIVSLYFLFRAFKQIYKNGMNLSEVNITLLIFLVYCCFSAIWANESINSFEKIVLNLLFPTLIAGYMALIYRFEQLLKCIFLINGIIIIISLMLIMSLPSVGISPINGDIRGVFIHKNSLGFLLLTNLTIGLSLYQYQPKIKKVAYIIMILISFVTLYFTQSTSNFLLAFTVIFIFIFIQIFKKVKEMNLKLFLLFFNSAIGLIVFFFIYLNINALFTAIGKDLTFTGRTSIWNAIFHSMDGKWWLGYGFDSFWIEGSSQKQYVDLVMRADVPHSHNLYVDLIATLGMIGLLLFSLLIVTSIVKSIKMLLVSTSSKSIFCLLFLLVLVIHEFNESYIFRPGTISNVLVIFILIMIVQNKKDSYNENSKINNKYIK